VKARRGGHRVGDAVASFLLPGTNTRLLGAGYRHWAVSDMPLPLRAVSPSDAPPAYLGGPLHSRARGVIRESG